MKIIVIGAGAMGCLYGAYLSKHNDVTMLDVYEPQVENINQNGITVLEEDGTEQHFSGIRAMKSGTCKEVADLVIVFVKSTHTESSLEENKDLFGENTLVMTLQNGAGNDRKIAKYVRTENIIIGTSKHNSVNLGGGKIRHSGNGVTTIGSNLEENTPPSDGGRPADRSGLPVRCFGRYPAHYLEQAVRESVHQHLHRYHRNAYRLHDRKSVRMGLC